MPWINEKLCTGCGDCIPVCILDAIVIKNGKAKVEMDSCHRCGACHDECPENAICYGESEAQMAVSPLPLVTNFVRRY